MSARDLPVPVPANKHWQKMVCRCDCLAVRYRPGPKPRPYRRRYLSGVRLGAISQRTPSICSFIHSATFTRRVDITLRIALLAVQFSGCELIWIGPDGKLLQHNQESRGGSFALV